MNERQHEKKAKYQSSREIMRGFCLNEQVLPEGKCGHRNVLSKRQVWMSIFHII